MWFMHWYYKCVHFNWIHLRQPRFRSVFEELHIRVNATASCTLRNPLHPTGSHSVPVETFLRLGTSQPSMLPRGMRLNHWSVVRFLPLRSQMKGCERWPGLKAGLRPGLRAGLGPGLSPAPRPSLRSGLRPGPRPSLSLRAASWGLPGLSAASQRRGSSVDSLISRLGGGAPGGRWRCCLSTTRFTPGRGLKRDRQDWPTSPCPLPDPLTLVKHV